MHALFIKSESEQEVTLGELNNIRNPMYVFTGAIAIILAAITIYFAIRKPKTRPKKRTKKKA
jgi:peptidoglycan/LPS O-acetylase OafA/YrhL